MEYTAYINLTAKEVKLKQTQTKALKKFLGSRGYAAKILYDNVGPGVEPLSEDNLLIFSPGLLTGTPWPTGARYTVTAKSPLTGAYGYSNSSGHFGPELRKAGFAALVFEGKSEKPVYLKIDDENIEIMDADKYWGENALETERLLKEEYEGAKVASIGQGGENLVKISSVINDGGRAAARCGLGAVMGFKNLKAVVVNTNKEVALSSEFKEKAKEKMRKAAIHPGSKSLRKWGTVELVDPKNQSGDLPTRNHLSGQFEHADKVNAKALDEYVYQNTGCYSCPIRCSRLSEVESGPYQTKIEGPEYETINAMGPMVDNYDMELIIYANKLCNEYGIDTISTGAIISFAMECHEKGLLDDENLSLEWGDKETILTLIKKIALREGLGDLLAEGSYRAAQEIGQGAEKLALHVKGMEIPMQEPRTSKAMGLGHATSNRGADHLYGLPTIDLTGNVEVAEKYFSEYLPEILEVYSQKYKPEMLNFTQEYNAISDALGVCKFSTTENYALLPSDIAEGISLLREDLDFDEQELLKAGERIINIERMYNYRHGMTREADQLPERFLKEPLNVYETDDNHPTEEVLVEELVVDLDEMLDIYYQLRGWNKKGVPTEETLKKLDLEELVEDL